MKTKTHLSKLAILFAALISPVAAHAVTIFEIVTPANPQGWGQSDTRPGGSSAITGTMPRNGDGSVELIQTGPSTAKADWATFWTPSSGNKFALTTSISALSQWSFDFNRSSTSNNGAIQAPAIRMFFINDTNNTSVYGDAGDEWGSLVWERAYNYVDNTPVDSWVVANPFTEKLWMRNSTTGTNLDVSGGFLTLSEWLNPLVSKPSGAINLDSSTLLYGTQISVGSGISGFAQTAVDNVTIGFTGGNIVNTNFELGAVPEPSSVLFLGLIGMAAVVRRQRQSGS